MSRVRTHNLDAELRKLSVEELSAMLSEEKRIQDFFHSKVSLVPERQTLIQQVKEENVRLARTNVGEAVELAKIDDEVAQLRGAVKDRQQQLKPLEQALLEVQEKDTQQGMIARLVEEASSLERETRQLVDEAQQAGGGELEKCLSGYVQMREKLHLKQELLERLSISQ